jgi:FkbH-like protein
MMYSDSDAMNIIAKSRKFEPQGEKLKRVYIAAGSQSMQHFSSVLQYLLNERGIPAVVRSGEYGSFRSEIIEKNSELYDFAPDYVIILPYHTDYLDIHAWQSLWAKLQGVTVIQANYVTPITDTYGKYADNFAESDRRRLELLNLDLCKNRPNNVIIADIDNLSAQIGKRQWFDTVAYRMNKSGFAMKLIPEVADFIAGIIAVSLGKTRKCLVLDLDNTLWGGVAGEEGGITLDPNEAKGEAFRVFQSYILALKNRGIILAVASKNDEQTAKSPFTENPNMVLKLDDIAVFKANWNDKATNIREIAAELNIGTDALAFFDDNPAEREIIKKLLPEVLTVDVPKDPSQYVRALYDSGAFDIISLSTEDLSRAESYTNNAKRDNLQTSFADYDEYLKSLEMAAKINREITPRFAQLINKSNQFNLRTRRYTDAEIAEMSRDGKHTLLSVEFRDKFDYYGIICCVILEQRGHSLFIDTWVMSCRVLKRGIENLIFNAILVTAKSLGTSEITGEYLPTAKNTLVKNLLDNYGFEITQNADGSKSYSLAVEAAVTYSHFIGGMENV